MEIRTLTHRALSARQAVETLFANGFEVGEPRQVTRTVLDTFDGRLHAAGLRLEYHQHAHQELVITAAGSLPARVPATALPRWADDLPRGPFRSRIAPLIEMRAVLPLATFTDRFVPALGRDREGKTVVTMLVHDDPEGTHWTIDVLAAAGHQQAAERATALLTQLGFVDAAGDLAGRVLAGAGVDPAGFNSSPTVPLQKEMPAFEGYRDVLLNLAASIRANWQGTIDDIDTEFLHELRVAVRRTRSVLGQSKSVIPDQLRDRFRDEFAWLAGLTGPTRDLDVYILEWARYVGAFPDATIAALTPVLDHLRQHRATTFAELASALRSTRAATLMASWVELLDRLDPSDDEAPKARSPLGSVVAKRLRRAHDTVIERGRRIDSTSPSEDLHDLRKDAKKLRYLVECFGSLLPESTRKGFVKQLKGLQDNLGEHQDAEVHAAEIRKVAGELNAERASRDTLVALGQLRQQLENTKQQARRDFADRFHEFDSKRTRKVLDEMMGALDPA